MKKLIGEKPKEEISILDVKPNQYFGVNVSGSKGFVTKFSEDYKIMCSDELTSGNHWPSVTSSKLEIILKRCLELSWKVFVFDTPQELFKWLSE